MTLSPTKLHGDIYVTVLQSWHKLSRIHVGFMLSVMSPAIVPLPGSDMLQPAAGVVPTLGKLIRSDEIRSAVYSTKFMETVAIVAFLAGNTLQPSVETAPHSAIELGV